MKRAHRLKIIKARREKRYSIVEVAKRSGLSYQTVIGIEKNYRTQKTPTLITLVKLAKALEIDIRELM